MADILIGATQWQSDEWLENYYPADLPAEWRLDYYANEFSTTLLEYREFSSSQGMDELAEMLQDCQVAFRPVVAFNTHSDKPDDVGQFLKWLDRLDNDTGFRRLAGVLLNDEMAKGDRTALKDWRQRIPPELPVALQTRDEDINQDAQWLLEHELSLVWRQHDRAMNSTLCWLAMVSLEGDAKHVASQVRSMAGQLQEDGTVCILADQGYENIARLYELATIVRLVHG